MKPTVYIETTIIGHLASRIPKDVIVAGEMMMTRAWWKESRGRFDVFSSEVVLLEAGRGDSTAAMERLEALADVALVPVRDSATALAKYLVHQHALPEKARVDAAHLAIAATNGLEYLLTWNCRHLANASLRGRMNQACRDFGCIPPIICTPHELREVFP